MSEATKETVNHPEHYNKHPSGVECITIVEHFNFNIGNAIKYLWRAGFKSPDPKEDLNKSVWYVQRELERLGGDIVDEPKKIQDELNRVRAENDRLRGDDAAKAALIRKIGEMILPSRHGDFVDAAVAGMVKEKTFLEEILRERDKWLADLCDLVGATSGPAALRGKIKELKSQAAKVEALEELLDQMRKGEKEREVQAAQTAEPAQLSTDNDATQPVIQKIGGYVRRTLKGVTPVGDVAEVIGWSENYRVYTVRRANGEQCEWFPENCTPCDPPTTKPSVG